MIELDTYDQNLVNYIKRNKNKSNLFICNIEHCSTSGMTRWIKIGMIYKGEFINITPLVKRLDGQPYGTRDGFKIGGCGMDMIFATLDTFFSNMGVKHPYKCNAVQQYMRF